MKEFVDLERALLLYGCSILLMKVRLCDSCIRVSFAFFTPVLLKQTVSECDIN